MFKKIKLLFTVSLLLTITNVEAQIINSIGLKFGYQKYTYKTYEIEHKNKSFLFSKRPKDNFLININLNGFFKNHIVMIPSFDVYRSSEKIQIIPNLDFAYYEYKSNKFLYAYGFGLGINSFNKLFSENSNKLRLNVNSFFSFSLPLNNQI